MTPAPTSALFEPVAVTGAGIVCSIAESVGEFEAGLRKGRCGVSKFERPDSPSIRAAATIPDFSWMESMAPHRDEDPKLFNRARRILKNNTRSTCLSAAAMAQAYYQARLETEPAALESTGLIVAGSNLDQDFVARNWNLFREQGRSINPRYAINFLDTNQLGSLSEIFSIRGSGYTVGAASASGNAAIVNAVNSIGSGLTSRCVVVGACSCFSALELEAFSLLGAAASGRHDDPTTACRPFDIDHEGFVWGEASACLVLESRDSVRARAVNPLGWISGCSLLLDGHQLPDPSVDGETRAMRSALNASGLTVERIGYVNCHGTSSPLGDRTECDALKRVLGDRARVVPINSTKSLVGHCMSAAGVVELLATVLQLNGGFAHPNLNLVHAIDPDLNFCGGFSTPLAAEHALSNGFGFGGINSTILISKDLDT